uniref:Uncharacterized protein n=1 Tax=Sphaerodactylus townsendi TaxID=933632 RepID=A0ACB8FFA5_9SAUR
MALKKKRGNGNLQEENLEAANISHKQRKPVFEIEKLGKTLQSLHLNVIASQQKRKMVLVQLEQQITQLEKDLTDARKLCSQKDQEICKRDDLLKKSKAALLQAREDIKAEVAEVEHSDRLVKLVKATAEDTQREKAILFRAEIRQVPQPFHFQKAQEFASQDEKLLMESSLKDCQGLLSEQEAETLRPDQ